MRGEQKNWIMKMNAREAAVVEMAVAKFLLEYEGQTFTQEDIKGALIACKNSEIV
jgi:hypothetical protein